jgi:predicted nuclease with RNAse H fold
VTRVLGIDLAGTSSDKTGYALVHGDEHPELLEADLQPRAKSPGQAEGQLLELIDHFKVDRLAIDAPLTLPPCLTCPTYCRGPDPNLCELQSARSMWEGGSNPVSRRPCEDEARAAVPGLDPKPTMGLGIITARAVALVRKLENRGLPPASLVRGELLEVYPRATLARLGTQDSSLAPKADRESVADFCDRVASGLGGSTVGLRGVDQLRSRLESSHDVIDAALSAYTGWLYPDGLEPPPKDFNVASGWIWYPKPA